VRSSPPATHLTDEPDEPLRFLYNQARKTGKLVGVLPRLWV
jgi:hypothetical protein